MSFIEKIKDLFTAEAAEQTEIKAAEEAVVEAPIEEAEAPEAEVEELDAVAELEIRVAELEEAMKLLLENMSTKKEEIEKVEAENEELKKVNDELSALPLVKSSEFKKVERTTKEDNKKTKPASEMMKRILALKEKNNK